jgi:hypothetical protein
MLGAAISNARIGTSAKAIHGFQRWHASALRRVSDHARELGALDATIGRATGIRDGTAD